VDDPRRRGNGASSGESVPDLERIILLPDRELDFLTGLPAAYDDPGRRVPPVDPGTARFSSTDVSRALKQYSKPITTRPGMGQRRSRSHRPDNQLDRTVDRHPEIAARLQPARLYDGDVI